MLQARVKPAVYALPSTLPRYGEIVPAPAIWRVLCGYQNCRGELAAFYCDDEATDQYSLMLSAGYIRSGPGSWRLARHAMRRRNHQPRRPRLSARSQDERAYRTASGDLMLPDGSSASALLGLRSLTGRTHSQASYGYCQFEFVALGATLTIECSRCHAPSQFTVQPSVDILEQEVSRFNNRRSG